MKNKKQIDLSKLDKCYIKLSNRILFFDGDFVVCPESVEDFIHHLDCLDKLKVTTIDDEIKKFNSLSEQKITTKEKINNISLDTTIPDEYRNIDVESYIFDKLENELTKFDNNNDKIARIRRVESELDLFKKHNLYPLLKTLIFIKDTLTKNNVVWGVGRGSSVASYLLYLIGIHDIDSVKFDLDIREFIKSP